MHARQEDLKLMISLFRPSYYLPIKGDFSLLMANAKLATELGIGLNHYNTFVYDNGMALIFDSFGKQVHKNILIKNGDVMVDGNSVGDVKETAIEERTKMADGGHRFSVFFQSEKNPLKSGHPDERIPLS